MTERERIPEMADSESQWERGWEEHDRQQRQRLAKLSLQQKIAWLEQAQRIVRQLGAAGTRPNTPADAE